MGVDWGSLLRAKAPEVIADGVLGGVIGLGASVMSVSSVFCVMPIVARTSRRFSPSSMVSGVSGGVSGLNADTSFRFCWGVDGFIILGRVFAIEELLEMLTIFGLPGLTATTAS